MASSSLSLLGLTLGEASCQVVRSLQKLMEKPTWQGAEVLANSHEQPFLQVILVALIRSSDYSSSGQQID